MCKPASFLNSLVLISFLLSFVSCKSEEVSIIEPDYLVFGHFYGECGGETCVEIFKLQGDRLYEDIRDKYPDIGKEYTGSFQLKSADHFSLVKDLPGCVPAMLASETKVVFGEPDAGDWGGIYIETQTEGKRRFYYIDTQRHSIPAYLHPFIDKVEEYILVLK